QRGCPVVPANSASHRSPNWSPVGPPFGLRTIGGEPRRRQNAPPAGLNCFMQSLPSLPSPCLRALAAVLPQNPATSAASALITAALARHLLGHIVISTFGQTMQSEAIRVSSVDSSN